MTDVFISYSRRDTDFVRQLFESLKARGREAWVDWQGIDYSTKWWEEICEGIERADSFVLVISPDSLNSEYCHREIEYARQRNKRLVTLIYRDVDEKTIVGGWYKQSWEILARNNWEFLQSIQFISYPKLGALESAVNALIETVDRDPEHVKAHTRLLLRVRDWENSGRSPSQLLRGDDLAIYERWLSVSAQQSPQATPAQHSYIAASRHVEDEQKAADARRESRIRRFRLTTLVMGIVGALAVIATAVAIQQLASVQPTLNRVATQVSAAESRVYTLRLAAEANSRLQQPEPDLDLVGTLAMYALKAMYSPEADAVLQAVAEQKATITRRYFDTAGVTSVAFAPHGSHFVTGNLDGVARRWPTFNINEEEVFFRTNTIRIFAVAYSHDARYVLTGGDDPLVRLYDAESGDEVRTFSPNNNSSSSLTESVAFSSDDRMIVAEKGGTVYFWETATGALIQQIALSGGVTSAMLSPDDRLLLASDYDGVYLFSVESGARVRSLVGHSDLIYDVVFSPDGQFIATASIDHTTRIWETETGREVRQLGIFDAASTGLSGFDPGVTDVDFSPDGRRLLTVSGKIVRVWDAESGAELRRLINPEGSVRDAVFSPDGRYILAGSEDNKARLWFTDYHDLIAEMCKRYIISGYLDDVQRQQFNITDTSPVCPQR